MENLMDGIKDRKKNHFNSHLWFYTYTSQYQCYPGLKWAFGGQLVI